MGLEHPVRQPSQAVPVEHVGDLAEPEALPDQDPRQVGEGNVALRHFAPFAPDQPVPAGRQSTVT